MRVHNDNLIPPYHSSLRGNGNWRARQVTPISTCKKMLLASVFCINALSCILSGSILLGMCIEEPETCPEVNFKGKILAGTGATLLIVEGFWCSCIDY